MVTGSQRGSLGASSTVFYWQVFIVSWHDMAKSISLQSWFYLILGWLCDSSCRSYMDTPSHSRINCPAALQLWCHSFGCHRSFIKLASLFHIYILCFFLRSLPSHLSWTTFELHQKILLMILSWKKKKLTISFITWL